MERANKNYWMAGHKCGDDGEYVPPTCHLRDALLQGHFTKSHVFGPPAAD